MEEEGIPMGRGFSRPFPFSRLPDVDQHQWGIVSCLPGGDTERLEGGVEPKTGRSKGAELGSIKDEHAQGREGFSFF